MSKTTLTPAAVQTRLALCAAAMAAGAAGSANAAIVSYTTPTGGGFSGTVPNNFDGVYINLSTGVTGTTSTSTTGWDVNIYNSGTAVSFFWNGTPASSSGGVAAAATGPYIDMGLGGTVGAGSTFGNSTSSTNTTAFHTAGLHILGFRFFNEATTSINFGYMTLESVAPSTGGFPLIVRGWSYEDSGADIAVPAIPAPAALAPLSMAALALGARARRKVA